MSFRKKLHPLVYPSLTVVAALAGGYKLGQAEVYKKLISNPELVIASAAKYTKDEQQLAESLVVKIINQLLPLTMAGMTISDQLAPASEATRRSLHLNVYSRLAAGATVFPLILDEAGQLACVLIKNKRKQGKLLPPEGYGKWGPLSNTPQHFTDLPSHDVDAAEEAVLRGISVKEAYKIAAGKIPVKAYPYGTFDLNFPDNAVRECEEEIGVKLKPTDLIEIDATTSYNAKWGLHSHTVSYFTILAPDTKFSLDPSEVESLHLIQPSKIMIQEDGAAKVEGFEEKIPADYLRRLEKVLICYIEMQLANNSNGLITSLAQLETYVKNAGLDYPKFEAFGTHAQTSFQTQLNLCKNVMMNRGSSTLNFARLAITDRDVEAMAVASPASLQ